MKRILLISAEMGYGHLRAIFPLKHISENQTIITIGNENSNSNKEKKLWKKYLKSYEFASRAGSLPIVGQWFKNILDKLLYIPKYYPYRDLSKPTLQTLYLKHKIKQGLCESVINTDTIENSIFVTSFYAPAIAADLQNSKDIYCIITDVDINRVWVSDKAQQSNIKYFSPEDIATRRLRAYGVNKQNIITTGFPLPLELLGNRNLDVLRKNLKERLYYLDPKGRFDFLYGHGVNHFLGNDFEINKNRKLTITYAVGGAGAQKEIALDIITSLKAKLKQGVIHLNLVAGTRHEVKKYFENIIKNESLDFNSISIIYEETIEAYFSKMNSILQTTDILWTKPSELSFYCALGIPVIVSKPIGPQEKRNRKWLFEINAGIKQYNSKYANEWINDLLNKGTLAEAAWSGFLKGRKYGTYKIEDYLNNKPINDSFDPLIR